MRAHSPGVGSSGDPVGVLSDGAVICRPPPAAHDAPVTELKEPLPAQRGVSSVLTTIDPLLLDRQQRHANRAAERRASQGDRPLHPPRTRPVMALVTRATLSVCSRLPLRVLHLLGGLVGACMAVLPTRSRRRSQVNLELCLPELAAGERRLLLRRSLQHAACGALELAHVWRCEPDELQALVRRVHGAEHLAAAQALGRGVIFAVPHLGAWEVFGYWLSSTRPVTALYRLPRIAEFDRLVRSGRKRFGAQLVEARHESLRTLVGALRRNECIMLLPDQVPTRGAGQFVPFFGQPAFTGTLLSRMAASTRAPVLWAHAERLPRGQGFEVHIRPSEPTPAGDLGAALAAVNRDVERSIRSCPEQYLWRYRRFRRQPPGVHSPYRP